MRVTAWCPVLCSTQRTEGAAAPDHGRIATSEQRETFLFIEPVLSGPCATMLARPYADLGEAMQALGTHIGGTCALREVGPGRSAAAP